MTKDDTAKTHLTHTKRRTLPKEEIRNVARLIDEGILRAQERLLERSRHDGSSLIFAIDGKVTEILPDKV
ncbi:MAG: hypothetical protein HUK04_01365 [Bacteroidaceae bacterium]|nr:hypothetical protein [Bacteroidaceae bacterium]